jgi:methylated-DNA-[protein]-cysteine S-methyltransferase
VSFYTHLDSPVGRLLLACRGGALTEIRFLDGPAPESPDPAWSFAERLDVDAVAQLDAYFAGDLQVFDLPLAPEGTPFQQDVWNALQEIPYGETTTYAAIAQRIGRPDAVRAVGAANGRNPLPIVLPCHRVVGSDGSLTGYAGGLHIKQALLALERRHQPRDGMQMQLFDDGR